MEAIARAQAALDARSVHNERVLAHAQANLDAIEYHVVGEPTPRRIPTGGMTVAQATAGMLHLNGRHEEAEILLARDRYVRGEIEIEGFEQRLDEILL